MKIVVIGGTGLIGSKVVSKLTQLGHEALAAAPNTGVNTITGEGLAEALEGAQVVVDLANSPSFDDQAAMDFFQTAGKNLIEAEKAVGVQLHVALSVVGTEHLQDSGYFRAKLAQETLIKNAPIPYTLLRATQFMEFLRSIAQSATEGNTVRLSHAFIQPMAAEDVAAAVVEAALAPPANGTIEVGGPEKFHLDELVARVLKYDKDPRKDRHRSRRALLRRQTERELAHPGQGREAWLNQIRLVARERRAAAEEVEPLADPDAAPCRAGRAAVHGALATTDEINHGPSPQKPSCCLPHPPPPLWKLSMTPRMNIFLSAREVASMTRLGTKRTL